MKLGEKIFRKDQPLWGKPVVAYDKSKMNELLSEVPISENGHEQISAKAAVPEISLETELYLILNS
ncbi:hypothetical protein [Poritiphilus flavus]|uniref:Uncharacterized protein n=1 Tax=Poritiphilus flavus TaxID=2697053 RepID=A0A6L9ECC3_9FLAO|nr:hypothetical protein [Poritiphilus flavus]NAS12404.1 hypothetical protein [Poritiphilus flavus]